MPSDWLADRPNEQSCCETIAILVMPASEFSLERYYEIQNIYNLVFQLAQP